MAWSIINYMRNDCIVNTSFDGRVLISMALCSSVFRRRRRNRQKEHIYLPDQDSCYT